MASTPGSAPAPDEGRGQCTPCRGTGVVISNLHGSAHQVTCPWCGGTGVFQGARDAQQTPAETSSDGA